MFILILLSSPRVVVASEVDFLAYGDLRGYLEPCGCDPATDLGGIRRINSQLRRERLNVPNVLLLNLGNNLSIHKKDAIKNRYLLLAEEVNKPDAYLVNILELQNLQKFSDFKLPFLLSNAASKKSEHQLLEVKGTLIFGYTWSGEIAGHVKKISKELLLSWKKSVARKKAKNVVLLFSGPDADLEQMVKSGLFTQIVSSNNKALSEDPGKDEVENESLLVRISDPLVFMVPTGGQGILRSGNMTSTVAKTLDGYLKKDVNCRETGLILPPNCRETGDQLFLGKSVRVTWLTAETESGHELANLYSQYNQKISAEFREIAKNRILGLKSSSFAGDQACAQCHQVQHSIYSKSSHASAMQTLINKGKHEDPECVACHSLGSTLEGGFVSVADSPQFANVQCENCHGPRKAHAMDPTVKLPKKVVGESVCITCHNRQHSSGFVFSKYWEKIKH